MATAKATKAAPLTPASDGTTAGTPVSAFDIPPITVKELEITIRGDAPLVCNQWSEKAKQAIRDKQGGKPRTKKEPKDPEADYLGSLYNMPDGNGYGFPAKGVKAAAVDACSFIEGVTKVMARGAFHIPGELLKIDGEPRMREDMVRIAMGTADIRYRAEFTKWSITFTIRYNANVLSPPQIIHLFNNAGFAIGIGEGRPQKDGQWGLFHVEEQ